MHARTLLSLLLLVGVSQWAMGDPVVPGYTVEECADTEGRIIESLSFDADGNLFVGDDAQGGPAAKIHRVAATCAARTLYGCDLDDPDGVLVDVDGVFAAAGSVLIGQQVSGSGRISAILQNQTCVTICNVGSNPSDLAFDSQNRLIFSDIGTNVVYRMEAGCVLSVLANMPPGQSIAGPLAVGPSDEVAVSTNQGQILRFTSGGTLISPSPCLTGMGLASSIAYGPGGDWGGDLYVASGSNIGGTGQILRVDLSTCAPTEIGTGVTTTASDIEFGPDGALYVSLHLEGRVLRIAPDCNGNGIPDNTEVDCNANGTPDDCDIANKGSGFTDGQSWSKYDAGENDGYWGAVMVGQYIYFVPQWNPTLLAIGEVLRYDTTQPFDSPAAYSAYDARANIGAKGGYAEAIVAGAYIYFVPSTGDTTDYHGEVLRYNTQLAFNDNGSWEKFEAAQFGVGNNPRGFVGGAFDGRYVYFTPSFNGSFHTEVLRYDTTAAFSDPGSWKAHTPAGADVARNGAVYDGSRYVYFGASSFSGQALRYDTSGPFTDDDEWETFDPGTSTPNFNGLIKVGRYIYYVPNYVNPFDPSAEVMRFDTLGDFQSAASWTVFNAEAAPVNAVGSYSGAVSDGRYLYFVPRSPGVGHGEVLRLDTLGDFLDSSSWETFDSTNENPPGALGGRHGGVFDGRFVYFVGNAVTGSMFHGEMLRFDTLAGGSNDCNSNGTPDECDVEATDCNGNNLPDDCELVDNDCDFDGVPDDCEPDCDADDLVDDCDDDDDGDGVLDVDDVCPHSPNCNVDPAGRPRLDLNNDCNVDGLDLQLIADELLSGCSTCP